MLTVPSAWATFAATGKLRTAKSSFCLPYAKIKLAVFPSKVQTLLLSKNLTYENFVSMTLEDQTQ